jgi:hypothetical protein
MSEKSYRDRSMPRSIDWQCEIGVIAGPYDGNRKGWLARAARKSGATYRQIKALWYGESVNPKVSVAIDVLKAAQEAREEARRLATQFESLAGAMNAGAMNASDPDFYCEDVHTLIDAARKIRGLDRA